MAPWVQVLGIETQLASPWLRTTDRQRLRALLALEELRGEQTLKARVARVEHTAELVKPVDERELRSLQLFKQAGQREDLQLVRVPQPPSDARLPCWPLVGSLHRHLQVVEHPEELLEPEQKEVGSVEHLRPSLRPPERPFKHLHQQWHHCLDKPPRRQLGLLRQRFAQRQEQLAALPERDHALWLPKLRQRQTAAFKRLVERLPTSRPKGGRPAQHEHDQVPTAHVDLQEKAAHGLQREPQMLLPEPPAPPAQLSLMVSG